MALWRSEIKFHQDHQWDRYLSHIVGHKRTEQFRNKILKGKKCSPVLCVFRRKHNVSSYLSPICFCGISISNTITFIIPFNSRMILQVVYLALGFFSLDAQAQRLSMLNRCPSLYDEMFAVFWCRTISITILFQTYFPFSHPPLTHILGPLAMAPHPQHFKLVFMNFFDNLLYILFY